MDLHPLTPGATTMIHRSMPLEAVSALTFDGCQNASAVVVGARVAAANDVAAPVSAESLE
jgi:hypothetical protein